MDITTGSLIQLITYRSDRNMHVKANRTYSVDVNAPQNIPIDVDIIDFKDLIFYNVSDDFSVQKIRIYVHNSESGDETILWNIKPSEFIHIKKEDMYSEYVIDGRKNIVLHLDKLGAHMTYITHAFIYAHSEILIETTGHCDSSKYNAAITYLNTPERNDHRENDRKVPITSYGNMKESCEYNDGEFCVNLRTYHKINGLIINTRHPVKSLKLMLNGLLMFIYADKLSIYVNTIKMTENTIYVPINESMWYDLIDKNSCLDMSRIDLAVLHITTDGNDDDDDGDNGDDGDDGNGDDNEPKVYAYVHNELQYTPRNANVVSLLYPINPAY